MRKSYIFSAFIAALWCCVACDTSTPSTEFDRRWANGSECDETDGCFNEGVYSSDDTEATTTGGETETDVTVDEESSETSTPDDSQEDPTSQESNDDDDATLAVSDDETAGSTAAETASGTGAESEDDVDIEETTSDDEEDSVGDDTATANDDETENDEEETDDVDNSSEALPGDGEPCDVICAEGLSCTLTGVCRELCGDGLFGGGGCDPAADEECCALTGHDQCVDDLVTSWCEPNIDDTDTDDTAESAEPDDEADDEETEVEEPEDEETASDDVGESTEVLPGDGEPCDMICDFGLTCTLLGVCREQCGEGLLGEGGCDPAVDEECCALTGHDQCVDSLVGSWCEPSVDE